MQYYLDVVILVCLFTTVNVAFNLIIGYAGLFAVGHGVFYAVGAFSSAVFAIYWGFPPWLAIIAAGLVTVLSSLLIALPSLRVPGYYLSIASLGLQVIVVQLILNIEILGGTSGLSRIPPLIPARDVGGTWAFIAVAAAIAILSVAFSAWLARLPFGRVLEGIREDETATQLLGKNVISYKIQVFMIGAGMTGVAGALYAHYYLYLNAYSFDTPLSIQLISMVLVGGMGTVLGPVVGTTALVILPEALRFVPLPASLSGPLRVIIYSLVVLIFLYFKPSGLVSGRGRSIRKNRLGFRQGGQVPAGGSAVAGRP